MAFTNEYITEKTDSIKDNSMGQKIKNKSNGYVHGAIAGGVIGVFSAVIFKKRMIVWGVVGAIAGGYIGYKVAEEVNTDNEFKNYSKN